jgi:glycosyltransferase involved in cell wall biosynthesis
MHPKPLRFHNWPDNTLPLVSVYCWTYNHKSYIQQCIESILDQETNFPVEIIIHDDASNDGTTDIVKNYVSSYPNVIKAFIQLTNQFSQGKSFHTNLIKQPLGKYVAITDCDDFWTSADKLQLQYDILEMDTSIQGSCHDTTVLTQHTQSSPDDWWQNFGDRTILNFKDIASTHTPFHTSSFMYRKSAYDKEYPFFGRSMSGDLIIYAMVASKGSIRRIPSAMSCYRKHSGGITESSQHQDQLRFLGNRVAMWSNIARVIPPEPAKLAIAASKNFENYLLSVLESDNRPNRQLLNILRKELGIFKAIKYVTPILKKRARRRLKYILK